MKREYDFSKAEGGKFYRRGGKLRLPIYLDARLQSQVESIAQRTGKDIGEVVNHMVKKEVRLIGEVESPPSNREDR